MTEDPNDPPHRGAAGLSHDWMTIWQSELNAAADDRERAQAWARMAAHWQASAREAAAWLRVDLPPRPAAPEPPAGPAAAAAAPDAGDAAVARLLRRVDALERRLAELDQAGGA